MRILALDASGACCSAALVEEGRCLGERAGGDSRTATAALPQLVHDLLAGRPFDAVAVTTGPGSFTGLRGALALGHGLALGAGVPVVGVTVAEALLQAERRSLLPLPSFTGEGRGQGLPSAPVWVALDARRAGLIFLDQGDGMALHDLGALPTPPGPVLVLGDAAETVCAAVPGAVAGSARSVSAADVARVGLLRLAGTIGPRAAQPLYVEPPAARPLAAP